MSFFPYKPEKANIEGLEGTSILHIQIEIEGAYGNEVLLRPNKSLKRKGCYWYDLYVGQITSLNNVYFICYPYSKLSKYLEEILKKKSPFPVFHKTNVNKVLEYMRQKNSKPPLRLKKEGFEPEITKYTAEVKESADADRVNLMGSNPLNSTIFEVLNNNENISIEATALKVKCDIKKVNWNMELSFDRLGNYRFWLKRDLQASTLPMINYVYRFFSEISSIEKNNYLSIHTFLENE